MGTEAGASTELRLPTGFTDAGGNALRLAPALSFDAPGTKIDTDAFSGSLEATQRATRVSFRALRFFLANCFARRDPAAKPIATAKSSA